MITLSSSPSVVIVGPVGAGKTSVGALLARHLDVPFVSVDEHAATRLGEPVSAAMITRPDGCEATQRELAIGFLSQAGERPMVLVLPPAASTSPEVTTAVDALRARGGKVVELTVDVAELSRRLGLNGPRTVQLGAPRAMLTRMLAATHDHHATFADVSVDTVGHSIEQVAQEVLCAL